MRSSFEVKLLVAFGAAVAVTMLLAVVTWALVLDAAEEARLASHTHEIVSKLEQIRGDTLQIELTTQSFRISGQKELVEERDRIMATREQALASLQVLLQKNEPQLVRWKSLRAVIDQRIAISKRIEQLRATQGSEAAAAYVAMAPLRDTREQTYGLLQAMDGDAQIALGKHVEAQLKIRKIISIAGTLVALLLAGLLVTLYGLIRRQLRQSENSQRALAQSEASLSTTLRSLGDGVLETDAQGRVTRMNPVAERLTGWPEADAKGRPVREVFHIIEEVTRTLAEGPVEKVIETGEMQGLASDTLLIRRDGGECPIGDSAAPVRDAAGVLQGVVLVFRDITAQHRAKKTIHEQNLLLERHVEVRTQQLQEAQDHLRNVMNSVPVMIAYVDADERYVYVNDQYLARFTPRPHSITGKTVHEVLGDQRYAIAETNIQKVLQGQTFQYDALSLAGIWQSVSYVPKTDPHGKVIGYYVLGADITERKRTEEKIVNLNEELSHRVQELERVSRALKTLSAGNSAMLRATDEGQLLSAMCNAIVDAGGYPTATVWYRMDDTDKTTRVMAESGYAPGLYRLRQLKTSWAEGPYGGGVIAQAIRTGETQVTGNMQTDPHYEPWREHLRGNASCIACPLRVGGLVMGALAIYAREPDAFGADEMRLLSESADDLAFGIASLRSRAAQEKAQVETFRLTHFDVLTGLANATLFVELLTQAMEQAEKTNTPFAVLQTNIERLSEINDALGFAQGDEMLREFATRLRLVAPDTSVVARLRGDEFAVLLKHGDLDAAKAMVQRVEDMLVKPFPIGDIFLDVTCKTGIALFPDHGASVHDMLRHVDIAVRQAKQRSTAHAIYDPQAHKGRPQRLNMAGELRRAIEGGDLLLHLQPKVDMVTRRVLGSEALVRWKHVAYGVIPPMQFIDLAEHTGLIKPLTEWVIESAMRLICDWQGQACALPIAVNLSAKNLRDEGLLTKIRQLQAEWAVPKGLLDLEITETALMDDAKLAMRVLHDLRAEGMCIYIDDFGTGYSSLSYLQKLPVDYIKIDQSFIQAMSSDKDSALIVRSTIDLTHDLGRKTVAEGVETQADWDRLADLGCDVAQGYFIARPMPTDAFPAWVAQYNAQLDAQSTANQS